ncbi:MAG: class II aldolase/adducin family protein [Rhizobiaceae bacterium]|nr:class II aldolase/adducin family protein [Rhizobiaceae bacterium]
MSWSDAVQHVIRELVIANRVLAHEGVIDDFGHISVRHPTDPGRYFLSRARSPELVCAEDIVEFTLEGDPVTAPNRGLYSERAIHGAIYMARPEVNAVAHHHARPVIPFTVLNIPLKPVLHIASVIGNEVPKWDSRDEFGDTRMLVDDLPKGHSLAKALGAGSSVLLRGHGSVCAAASLSRVCFISIYLSDNARILLEALRHGTPTYLTPEEVRLTADLHMGDVAMARAWEYYKARAGFHGL